MCRSVTMAHKKLLNKLQETNSIEIHGVKFSFKSVDPLDAILETDSPMLVYSGNKDIANGGLNKLSPDEYAQFVKDTVAHSKLLVASYVTHIDDEPIEIPLDDEDFKIIGSTNLVKIAKAITGEDTEEAQQVARFPEQDPASEV